MTMNEESSPSDHDHGLLTGTSLFPWLDGSSLVSWRRYRPSHEQSGHFIQHYLNIHKPSRRRLLMGDRIPQL
jgi:hypothetical protein